MLKLFLRGGAVLLLTVACYRGAFATNDLSIAGTVKDAARNPVADATVVVYHAGPRTGYSLFCPSCYSDCGKRAVTDSKGMFSFHHLSEGLWFELLVARSGYRPKFVEKVVPASDASVTVMLDPRPTGVDLNRVFHGRIVDSSGLIQRNALVQPVGSVVEWQNWRIVVRSDSEPGSDCGYRL